MNAAASKPKMPVLSTSRAKAPEVLVEELEEDVADELAFVVELSTRLEQLTFDGIVALLNKVKSAHCRQTCQQITLSLSKSRKTNLEKSTVTSIELNLDCHVRAICDTRDVQVLDVNRKASSALAARGEERNGSGECLARRCRVEFREVLRVLRRRYQDLSCEKSEGCEQLVSKSLEGSYRSRTDARC